MRRSVLEIAVDLCCENELEMAKEVVLAAHNGDTERLRALLEANPNLVDAVRRAKFALLLGRNETSR